MTARNHIRIAITGIPRPAGSKRSFPFRRDDGSLGVRVTDANKHAKVWKACVRDAARAVYGGPPLTGAVFVHMDFFLPRPKSHFGTGRNASNLRDTAPLKHIVRPDTLKLARGTEDALTGIIWRDDAQVVKLSIYKGYAGSHKGSAIVMVWATTESDVELIMRNGKGV